jgi:hypothetical protein
MRITRTCGRNRRKRPPKCINGDLIWEDGALSKVKIAIEEKSTSRKDSIAASVNEHFVLFFKQI